MKLNEKKCPDCAETIKKDALVCKHCGRRFDPAEVKAQLKASNKDGLIGCAVILGVLLMIGMCSAANKPTKSAEELEAEAKLAKVEEETKRKSGFHCLSAWDGSHRGIVESVKKGLREPDSFEHIETVIGPVTDKGIHALSMKYRARNGFGGMNVGTVIASVRNSDCGGEILLASDD
jgi:hypothetical protein